MKLLRTVDVLVTVDARRRLTTAADATRDGVRDVVMVAVGSSDVVTVLMVVAMQSPRVMAQLLVMVPLPVTVADVTADVTVVCSPDGVHVVPLVAAVSLWIALSLWIAVSRSPAMVMLVAPVP
jgi:hypothetical protein